MEKDNQYGGKAVGNSQELIVLPSLPPLPSPPSL